MFAELNELIRTSRCQSEGSEDARDDNARSDSRSVGRVPRDEKMEIGGLFINGSEEGWGFQMNCKVKEVHSVGERREDPIQ